MDQFVLPWAARSRDWRAPTAMLALVAVAALALPLAACGSPGAGTLTSVTIGLTYVPDVQFAPFYVAAAKGYYRDAGLNVTFHHGIETNEFGLLAAGKEDAIFAGGDETLEARSQAGIPLVDVATIFQKYPVVLVVPAASPIHTAADLRGHSIGVPGPYGATYTGLLALLHGAGLSKTDVTIKNIGFTQVTALLTHQVDAVMGYANNEPIQLAAQGFAVRAINIWDVQPLVSNGLVVLSGELKAHPDVVKAIVKATLQGVRETMTNPTEAVRISASYVPGLDQPAKAASALTVLQATIPLWQGASQLGYNDPATWQSMATFLGSAGLVHGTVNPAPAFSNSYLPS